MWSRALSTVLEQVHAQSLCRDDLHSTCKLYIYSTTASVKFTV